MCWPGINEDIRIAAIIADLAMVQQQGCSSPYNFCCCTILSAHSQTGTDDSINASVHLNILRLKGTPCLVQRACMLIALQSVRVRLEALCVGAHTARPVACAAHPQHSPILYFLHAPPAQSGDTQETCLRISPAQSTVLMLGLPYQQPSTLRLTQACKQCCHLQGKEYGALPESDTPPAKSALGRSKIS